MKVATVVGTRPQFVKAAVVSRALRERHREILIHTGQHYDINMSGVFFAGLDIPAPDYCLNAGSGAPGRQLAGMLGGLESVFDREKPDIVLVYGDSRSTLAAALAASKAGVPLAHVEAGLRSHRQSMPEEFNRIVTDHLSSILFCPSETAVRNLEQEGFTGIINRGRLVSIEEVPDRPACPQVVNVGDVMVDVLLEYAGKERCPVLPAGKQFWQRGKYLLATVHRAENTDNKERLAAILESFAEAGEKVVFPVHPRTAKKIVEFGLTGYLRHHRIDAIEPVGYLEMLCLIKNARMVLTDSGGVQKEAFILKVPCITLREETEWVETVERGCNVLVGCAPELIRRALATAPACDWSGNPYGRGDASRLIARVLEGFICRG
ncbi:MAG: UDP-N-acetyl glucosamine 2-epimerase [Pelotomaculum sp.]|uniref:UDP-N-acetylglucosamine 2-epimerase n=1 Tax=Pelotomaculum thermopropionicum (strain DSM 13744 / JCM 10971 / SI) TaxID=370438 RepID=A5D383_PELTS|nr:UDP-N-acetyl glucosamine 2-epimerase [Pelotomaculum sp.]BAF59284.1 UDP-N-acetylglucosamine 2-epimerase [Pelotomaculum thermopropionicum SI]